jgi:hypothetical protein
MTTLEQVMDLKSKGVPDQEIIRKLQEQGISPGEITDSLSKAQIKSAVSDMGNGGGFSEGMEPSILGSEDEPYRLPTEGNISDIDLTPPIPGGFQGQQLPAHVTREVSDEQDTYYPQENYSPQDTYTPQETYSPQQQPQYPQYSQLQTPSQENYEYTQYAPGGGDTDTMIEVAEQVFSEKNKPIQKKVDEMNEFRSLAQTKLDNISERMRRIENIIDKLQASILEKIGSYGHGFETIRKEMNMMQESFGKIVNKVADSSETKHHTHHNQHQSTQHHEQKHHQQTPSHHVTVHKSKKTTRKSHSSKK